MSRLQMQSCLIKTYCPFMSAKSLQSCLTLCDPMDCNLPGSFCPWGSPGKNIGVGCHAFLQGIFPTQGSNPGLLNCRWILYCLSHQGNPFFSRGMGKYLEVKCHDAYNLISNSTSRKKKATYRKF